jgi:general secretion pathway protein G
MEMLVVVAILVVLAGASVPIYMRFLEESKVNRAKADVRTIAQAVEAFYLANGDFPATLAELTQPRLDGSLPYLPIEALLDPWNREYQYAPQGQHNAMYGKPDVWSLGPRPADPNGIIGNWSALQGAGGL